MNYINRVFLKQKAFFNTQITKNITYRKTHLRHLLETINHHFTDIVAALNVDLNKSEAESYISEILLVQNEIKTMLKNIKHWSKPKHVRKNILNLLSRAHILKEPYGVVLVCVP
jgi:aldehyde dehydrogenase (NAD+)